MSEKEVLEKVFNTLNTTSKNILILIGGAPGAGKTTLARKITEFVHNTNLKIIHIDIDDKNEKELFLSMGGTDEEWPFYKWKVFHSKINESLNKNNITIATATLGRHVDRKHYENLCSEYDIEFLGIWIDIDISESIKRQKQRAKNEGHIDPVETIEERTKTWFEKYKEDTESKKFSNKWIILEAN